MPRTFYLIRGYAPLSGSQLVSSRNHNSSQIALKCRSLHNRELDDRVAEHLFSLHMCNPYYQKREREKSQGEISTPCVTFKLESAHDGHERNLTCVANRGARSGYGTCGIQSLKDDCSFHGHRPAKLTFQRLNFAFLVMLKPALLQEAFVG